MTSIIIAGRPNSEETSECIIVAENIANLYPSSRFTIVLKSPSEWENYCEDLCNLFGILKKSSPLILLSNGEVIGGRNEFFKLIHDTFKYDALIEEIDASQKKTYRLDIDSKKIMNLTKENLFIVENEYTRRTEGLFISDKIKQKLDDISVERVNSEFSKFKTFRS